MNRSTLKHSPFIAALFGFFAGDTFGRKLTAEEKEARDKRAKEVIPFIAPPKAASHGRGRERVQHHDHIARARKKVVRQARHTAQQRLRRAA